MATFPSKLYVQSDTRAGLLAYDTPDRVLLARHNSHSEIASLYNLNQTVKAALGAVVAVAMDAPATIPIMPTTLYVSIGNNGRSYILNRTVAGALDAKGTDGTIGVYTKATKDVQIQKAVTLTPVPMAAAAAVVAPAQAA